MRATLRQTFALSQLILRYWARAGLPNPVRSDQSRRASGAILRVAFVMLFVNWGYRVGTLCNEKLGDRREPAFVWLLVGLFGAAVIGSAHGRMPGVRSVAPPTSAPFLDTLPLETASRAIIALLERITLYGLGVSAFVGAVPDAPLRATLLAVGVVTAALLAGDALLRTARVLVPPMHLARLGVALVFFQLPFLILMALAPSLASIRARALVDPARGLARAVVAGEGKLAFVAMLVGIGVVSAIVIRTAERIGYDRVDVVPDRRLSAANSRSLTIEGIEAVLTRREPGGRFGLPLMLGYTLLASGGALFAARTFSAERYEERIHTLIRIAIFVATFGAFVLVNARATRMVARDAVARPFLAPLPITPADMLKGKARALRRRALLVAAPSLLLFGVPGEADLRIEIVFRLACVLTAVALAAEATVSVAFLTQGLGAVRSSLGSFNLETMLVAMPLFAAAAPPHRWAAGIGVGALALLAFEARRAALACVRWMDDGDDFARETPAWRALLVFAAFHATHALTQRALAFVPMYEATQLAISYAVAALALVALTLQARRGLTGVKLLPKKVDLLPALVLGGGAGALTLFYGHVLRVFDVEMPAWTASTSCPPPFLFALLVVAPVAEEVFFRGWLQSAIEGELSERRRWLAPVLASVAFAGVHRPLAFVPVLVLGVAIGFLYARTRSLGAAIVARSLHDGLAAFAFV